MYKLITTFLIILFFSSSNAICGGNTHEVELRKLLVKLNAINIVKEPLINELPKKRRAQPQKAKLFDCFESNYTDDLILEHLSQTYMKYISEREAATLSRALDRSDFLVFANSEVVTRRKEIIQKLTKEEINLLNDGSNIMKKFNNPALLSDLSKLAKSLPNNIIKVNCGHLPEIAVSQKRFTLKACQNRASIDSEHYPKKISQDTTITGVSCRQANDRVIFVYLNKLDTLRSMVSKEEIEDQGVTMKNKLCSDPILLNMLKVIDLEYVYYDSEGSFIGRLTNRIEDCRT